MATPIYPPTNLDASQVIQLVYDEATQTLRTTSSATIIVGDITVDIDGVYGLLNQEPDNIGLIGHTRTASPGPANQTVRLTSIVNSDVRALDVAIHNSDGSDIGSGSPLVVNFTNTSIGRSWVLNSGTDSVSVSNFPSSLTIADISGDYASNATITPIARSLTSQVVVSSNPSRKSLFFHNDTDTYCYVAFAATASSAVFTMRISTNNTYIMDKSPSYTGIVSVVWPTSGIGNLFVTEIS